MPFRCWPGVPVSTGYDMNAGRLRERVNAPAITVAIAILSIDSFLLGHNIVVPDASSMFCEKNTGRLVKSNAELLVPDR